MKPNSLHSHRAENLDGFFSSADLRAHAASVANVAPGDYLQYAEYKAKAMELRAAGDIVQAIGYEHSCDALFNHMPKRWRW